MIVWPHAHSDWRSTLTDIEQVYSQLTHHITRFERLLILYYDDTHLDHIKALLAQHAVQWPQIGWCQAHSNDSWARDFGPISVTINGQDTLLDFHFNGWGNKYPSDLDNQITRHLHQQGYFGHTGIKTLDFVLEGGAIDCDGKGSLLTTTACLLAPTRNPQHDQHSIELMLSKTLGIDRVLWLTHGKLSGDDTDGHIDMLARFCSCDTIAYSQCNNPADSHFESLQAMQKELEQLRCKDGSPYHLVALPLPQAIFNDLGERLPASYANFLIINNAVLLPSYDDPADTIALQCLQSCFPEHEIIAIDCLPLIQQYGSLHCATMHFPKGVLLTDVISEKEPESSPDSTSIHG